MACLCAGQTLCRAEWLAAAHAIQPRLTHFVKLRSAPFHSHSLCRLGVKYAEKLKKEGRSVYDNEWNRQFTSPISKGLPRAFLDFAQWSGTDKVTDHGERTDGPATLPMHSSAHRLHCFPFLRPPTASACAAADS